MADAAATNLALIQRFLGLVLEGDADAALALVSDRHVEHSTVIAPGRAGLAEFLAKTAAVRDETRVEVERMIADADHVVVHMYTTWLRERRRTAAIDIFRIEDDRIVEHWDVIQPVPFV